MGNGIDLPEGLIKRAAAQMLRDGDLSERIREVDGPPKPDTSIKDVYIIVEQLLPRRWRATTVEDITIHGPVVAHANTQESVEGQGILMALTSALLNGGVFNDWLSAQQHVLHRMKVRIAHVRKL